MNYSQLDKFATKCQMESDYASDKYLSLAEKTSLLLILQNHCSFNVIEHGCFGDAFVNFVVQNRNQLTRKFSQHEYDKTRGKWYLCKMKIQITDFAQLKKIKIKPHRKTESEVP